MKHRNIFKVIASLLLFMSSLLFILPTTMAYFYMWPLFYNCLVVPFLIAKIWFNDKLKNEIGFDYKIPIVIFLAILQFQFEMGVLALDDTLSQKIFLEDYSPISNPFKYLLDVNIYCYLKIIFIRIISYGLMIYVCLPKKNELNLNVDSIPENNTPKRIYLEKLWAGCAVILSVILTIVFGYSITIFDDGIDDRVAILIILIEELCLFSLLLSLRRSVRKKARIIFGITFLLFVLSLLYTLFFTDANIIDACYDVEHGVWDYEQRRCRTDCQTWNWQDKCVPLSGENEVTQPQ